MESSKGKETQKARQYHWEVSPILKQHMVDYNTLWIKFVKPKFVAFVGKDGLIVGQGCHILVCNFTTDSENIVVVNSEKYGDSIACMAGHKTQPYFVYAETHSNPRIFVMTYPHMAYANVLSSKCFNLSALAFSEGELLFGVSGYPDCMLFAWKWRTGEYLTAAPTKLLFHRNVILKTNYNSQPIFIALLIVDSNEMQLWEVTMCGTVCIMREETIRLNLDNPRVKIQDVIWTIDNSCFAMDTTGTVYQLNMISFKLEPVIKLDNDIPCMNQASFGWQSNGILLQGPDHVLRFYKKNEAKWTLQWNSFYQYQIYRMYAHIQHNYLVVITGNGDIQRFDGEAREFSQLRTRDGNITHFGLIPPQNECLVTLSKFKNIILYDALTGTELQIMHLDFSALYLACNPYYPYFGVTFDNGMLCLYSCIKRKMEILALFSLTKLPLQNIKYFENNKVIAVANMDVGQIFIIQGVPGSRYRILSSITHNAQIADYAVVGAKNCLRLFIIPVTSERFIAGNKIVRYCIIKDQEPTMKIYELENPDRLYMSLYITRNQPMRDRLLYAAPFDCKNLHELEFKRGDTHARIVNRFKSEHMMRMIYYVFDTLYTMSYAYDGIIIIRSPNFEIQHVIIPHHPMQGGIIACVYDYHNYRTFSLGNDGLLIGSAILMPNRTSKYHAMLFGDAEELADIFKKPTSGFMPKGIFEGLTWLEHREQEQIEQERIMYQKQRQRIVEEFNKIKEEAMILYNHNLDGPENERLDQQEFNMHLAHKEELIKNNKEQCERLKSYLKSLIHEQDRVFGFIKGRFWDLMNEPKRNLWAIFGNYDVQNYPTIVKDAEQAELLEHIKAYREVEAICAADDTFKPWVNYTETDREDLMEIEPLTSTDRKINFAIDEDEYSDLSIIEREAQHETYVAFHGSAAPNIITVFSPEYEQAEVHTSLQRNFAYTIAFEEQQLMRNYFNKEFETCVQQKVREMVNIIERNARLRYIISEINYFSEEKLDITLYDPEWKQDENPELLTKVDDSEVSILPYISPSEQAILDAKAAEEERIRLLLLADDFKERALMKMMNGVLEIRWEDELRREVPKPKCMINKNPEDYNEEDLKALKDYDEACIFLHAERERYKTILNAEYSKVGAMLRDGVKKFNERLKQLCVKKMQVESTIINENLRITRLAYHDLQRTKSVALEKQTENLLDLNDKKTDDMMKLINNLSSYDSDLKSLLDALILKEKIVDKGFKKEFQDLPPTHYEIVSKLYKKRPKISMKVITSHCILHEMASALSTNKPSLLLFGDNLEFVKSLDFMDKFINVPLIDEPIFQSMCRTRRLKIELELKIRAYQLEMSEAENTKQMYRSHLVAYKEKGQSLISAIDALREKQQRNLLNIEIQLVIKQAFVELPRVGTLQDFVDAVLVNRKDVEEINGIIIEAGNKKVKAMTNALQFRKEIMQKEWLHLMRKMRISDLNHELQEISSVKLTKDIQQYLKSRARGDSERTVAFEHEVEQIRALYDRQIAQRQAEIADLDFRLKALVDENDRLNKEILKVNVDVNEANVQMDTKIGETEKKMVQQRVRANLKRSQMVNQIQVNHNQIMVLQAELELWRLRTVPILDYKVET